MANIPVTKSYQFAGNTPSFPGAAKTITKSDTDTYDNDGQGIVVYVGTGGDVTVVPNDGDRTTAVVFKNMASGTCVPCRCYMVKAATTAQDLLAIS